ncbi:tyrosine--tRNA ligase [Paenibacillus senegalensis]|uniref:tyrosine--tRNA ligase n=1 Tax=Paenibacillus senegalensis TaxID=1465766 RepID=UPI00047510EE|nr:tyrosine--tRNA ligase [Paenibacillus senegalensis]
MDSSKLSKVQQEEVQHQWEVLSRGTVEIVPEDTFRTKITESVVTDRPLKVKLGLDPSAPDIHIGHTVVLHKLRQFQQFGHHVQLVIGDFTGRIGDPSGRSETRKPLSEEDVKRNAETYRKQIMKILHPEKTEIVFNSEWLAGLAFAEVVQLASKMTVARMLERDDFHKRYTAEQPIHIHEFFYPLMQGYDSIALKTDIELGGTDQKFNLLMGRTLQREYGLDTQAAVMMPLLEGLDGVNKMSKSLGNYIGIDEPPQEIYGKAMSIPDELMIKYFELATDIEWSELRELEHGLANGTVHPRDAKMKLASSLVRMYHSPEAAQAAEQHFVTVFQQGAIPEDISDAVLPADSLDAGSIKLGKLLVALKLQASNGEARRSVEQGAVRINGEKWTDPQADITPANGDIVQVGKRRFARIVLE